LAHHSLFFNFAGVVTYQQKLILSKNKPKKTIEQPVNTERTFHESRKAMVKMTTPCRRFDTSRLSSTLFALAMFATVLTTSESKGQNPLLDSKKSYSVLLNPPVSTTDSETEIELPQEPQISPEPEVLMRGPLHEAFAEAYLSDPQPNPVIDKKPPADIKELPPEFRPEGKNIIWVAGYWSWDEAKNDFIWISGVWRDAPPKRNWIPGYWEDLSDGARWISGFWLDETQDQEELSYLPEPPSNFENGPSAEAPNENYFYCPGHWEFQRDQQEYFWRSGHWHPREKNWIWIPSRYVWTPRGCVYRRGYWDYEFEKRGTVFAPVAFADNRHFHYSYRYRPDYCIDIGANFFVHLFFRDNCSQYYFGDYYDNQIHNNHYHSWVNRRNLRDHYDPLMAHYCGRSHRYNDFPLLNWIDTQHRYYETYRNLRPQISLSAHINLTGSPNHHDRNHDDYFRRSKLANRYSDRDHGADRKHAGNQTQQPREKDDRSSKPIRVNDRDHQQHVKANQIAKQKSDRRKKSEARAAENQLAANKSRAEAAQKQRERNLEKQNRDLEREQKLAEIKQKSAENKLARETRSTELKRKQELERQAKLNKKLPPSQTATSNTRPSTNSLSRTQQKEIEKAAKKKADEIKRAQQQQVLAQQRAERDEKSRIARQEYEQKKKLRDSRAKLNKGLPPSQTATSSIRPPTNSLSRTQQKEIEKTAKKKADEIKRAQQQQVLAQQRAERDERSRIARQEYEQKKKLRESQANAERERSRVATEQKIAEAKRADQIKDQQRAAEKAQRDRESASRRAQLQVKLAQEKAQRAAKDQAKEAQRQADKARRDRETQQRRAETQAKKENRKKK
jgi:hypothetical protein